LTVYFISGLVSAVIVEINSTKNSVEFVEIQASFN
jgi:hypothetical protein